MNLPWAYMFPPHPELPSHIPSHPTPLGCHRAPALGAPPCIKLTLDICFTQGNVYVSKLFSQIIPPSPFSTEFKCLFFTLCLLCCPACTIIHWYHLSKFHVYAFIYSIHLFLPCKEIHQIPYICIKYMIFVFLLLTYFTMYNK